MKKGAERLGDIILSVHHPGCSFFESPENKILVIINLNVADLVAQTEQILKKGYELAGGINLIRRDDGSFNGHATFINKEKA